jgi:hypothetical protein
MRGSEWLLLHSSMLSVAWPVVVLLQVACVVHVLKTGRPYWWIWIIFGFPLVGLLAYVFLEVRPSWRRLDLPSLLWNFRSSADRIRILEGWLEESSTVKNRLALADELQNAGRYDRQCQVLSEGLRGAFADDAQLLMRLSQAHLEAGRPAEAEQILRKIAPPRSSDAQFQLAVLRARVLAGWGRQAEAEGLFQELIARKKSEAPRFYFAEFLLRTQRPEEAITLLKDILRQYRRGTPVWRYQERKWFYAARRALKSPPASAPTCQTPVSKAASSN